MDTLVAQLGDADVRTRDAATQRLRALGEAALPALKQAASHAPDLETRSRAASLVRRIESGSIPGGPLRANDGRLVAIGLQVSVEGKRKTLSVNDGVRQIKILEEPGRVEMTVTAPEDGKPNTASYHAASRAALRAEEPEAFRLFDRWASLFREDDVEIRGAAGLGGLQRHGALQVRADVNPGDALRRLADDLDKQMPQSKFDVATRKEVFTLVERLRELQAQDPTDPEEVREARMKEIFSRSDELRQRLAELKLPDPGDALPPPSKSRLGIGYNAVRELDGESERVIVSQVVTGSRGDRIGMKAGDVLKAIGGRPVKASADVRPALVAAEAPLTVKVEREGAPMTLTEAPEAKP